MINLDKNKDLDKYIEYVNAQKNYSEDDLRIDLAERGLTNDEINYVMTFYEPRKKQKMFSHPFSFKGRIRRLEYGLSYIIIYVYAFIIGLVTAASEGGEDMMYIFLIPAYWFIWAQGAKRCHDRGNSGWYQLIPFYGLWMLLGDGEECDNEYGSDPKGRSTFS